MFAVHNYIMQITVSNRMRYFDANGSCQVQLSGEFGESGYLSVKLPEQNGVKKKKDKVPVS